MKSLKISTIDAKGEISGEQALSASAFENLGSLVLVSQAVKAFLSNQRKALAKTKTRSLVFGTKSKIYRQKGTGRARHGDRQAPIFVGGGVSHGPTGTQNYKKKINQKMTQKTLATVLAEKAKDKKVFLVQGAEFTKTKEAASYIEKVRESLKVQGEVAFVLTKKDNLRRFLNNLKDVQVLNAESLNSFYLLKADLVLVTDSAFKALEQYLGAKKNESND
ncbi:MAG: 50S ribosomal protein L4 [Patescibacteria group bacterium]|jgi:large subunit ribosomal protein L4